jgi:4'-phosphopantetheinyl transferase
MLCGVTLDRAIGVDVEDSRRRVEGPGIARRFFAPAEVRALERGELAFFELWTLKEAYIKARGQGLALPLRRFAFRRRDHDISVTFEPELGDDAGAWRFLLLGVQPSHVAALALRTGADAAPPTVRVGQVVPLHREGELPCAVLGRTGER